MRDRAARIRITIYIALSVTGFVVLGVMLATGYMPGQGFGRHPAHALRFGLTAGLTTAFFGAACIDRLTYVK